MPDYRIEWLRDRISKTLGIFHLDVLDTFITDHLEQLQTFFDDEVNNINDFEKCIFYVYRTFYDRLVEREVITIEKVPRIITPPPVVVDVPKEKKGKKGKAKKGRDIREEDAEVRPDPDIDEDTLETTRSEKKKKDKPIRRRKGVIDDSEPEGTPDRPPVIQEFSLIEVRKIERSFEKTPILHLAFGINPPEEIDENMRCVYFIRKSAEAIAHYDRAEEAMAEMSQMFYLGSLKGSFMHNLADITMSVWKTTVDLQLRIPLTREKETFESRDHEDIETEEKIGLIDFSKPSDFRLKAITSNYTGFPNGDELNSGKVSANGITSPSSATTTKTGNTPYEEPTPLTHDEKWKELCALADHEATLGRESMCKAPEKVSSTIEILQNNLDKFQSTIQWTIDHAICAFTLPTQYIAPGQESIIDDEDKVKIKVDPIKMSLDDITTSQLEEIVDGWIKYVTKAFRDALDKEPDDPTPISEYELWDVREKEYNNIIEQLKSPFAQLVFDKLKKSESSVLSGWPQIIEKLHIERDLARENAEYLSTLQEYFIKIRDQENFSFIISIVPSMMTGLRHIWTMSSYYCSDENMLILLTKISNIFTIKVKKIVDLEKIFSLSATAAYQRAIECVNLLQCWKNSYMETRAQIENSGVGSRWEFDKKILFGQVDHVTRISQDIANVAKAFYEFENMFGHRLRTYVADPEEVDIMIKKVYRLLQHILNIDYDIFVPNNKDNWEATLEYFYKCLDSVENEAKKVLDQCIDSLKSAEQGLDLIKHLNGVETREKLLKNLLSKKENIMRKFVTEVGVVENEFLKHRKDPPLQRNQNKYSGAVIWVRFLFEKLKKSVVAFRTMEDNENTSEESYLKRSAFNQYYAISRDMTTFEKDIFSRFLQEGTFVVNNVLKRNILKLKYLSLPIEAYEEKVKKKDVQLAPVRISKSKQKQKTGATLAPIKKEPTGKSKFSTMSTTIKWMVTRPGQDSPDLALAQKLVKKSSIESLNSKDARSDFKISQAKLMTIATQQAKLPTWKEVIGNSLLIEYELKFDVNFSHQIFDIMTEGQQFEFLGFTLNPVIRMAIMRKEQLSSDVEQVTKVVNEYNNIVAKMTPAEIQFLRENLYEVESMIQVGLGRYTWQTLNIKYFCDSCQKLLKNLDAIVSQINYMGRDIKLKVTTLEAYCFFSFEKDQFKDTSSMTTQIILKTARSKKQKSETPDDIDNTTEYEMSRKKSVRIQERDDGIKPCLEYFRSLELERNKKTIEVEKLYNSIGPTMIKLESLILGTFTGESEKMNHYYIYWEKELFAALVRFTTKNLEGFSKNLMRDEAIFEVDAVLAAPEINMRPAAHEVYNIMIHSVKDFLERLKCFRRWMTETCLPCPPAKDEKNELYVFTFYEDVVQLPKVYELVLSLQQTIQSLVSEVRSYLSRWHKYKSLWMYDKNVVCDKYLNRGIPLVRLDEKFIFYTQIINDLENVKPYYDIKSIRINLQPLIQAIIEHAVEWRNTLGNMLSDKTCMEMVALNTEFKTLRLNLDRNIKQLADFKIVMSTINTIQTTTLTMELKIKEMQETYNVLEEHRIKFPYGDMLMAYHLEKRWKKLFNSALYRIQTLHSTKVKFSQMTLNDIKIFCSNLNDFIFKFQTEGPGTVEQDMDKGQKLMEHYGEEFERLDAIRLEMVNAEKLFDIEMTDYSDFLNAKEDFEKMLVIYKLYQTQKVARETWSKTLWANLNPQALTEGIENFLRDFRKLPKPIKQMPIGQALELNMKQFKNVVPLMVNLKNEALRERHWKMLMEKTGKVFDMSPGRFTLENMFSMELHKYTNIVEEIVTNAVKELAIERGVKEIAETWDKINFNIIKHVKDGEEVGSLLGSTEEIIQILNDNSMNLQSMIGSQFIGPFLQTVQKWEKCLNMVTEIIDEWLEVQKKWLYLEGIFIGGDISEQLPDEARRFNDIDKAFKRIMSDTAKTLVVVDVCMAPGRLAELQGLSAGLDKCQKSLNDYLESKKNIFPRFYFISTEELLSILGSNKCSDVQEHMIKMFDNVKSMNFRETRSKQTFVTALKSCEGEIMVFKNHIETEGRVEYWMNLVLDEMRKSNRFLTKKAIFDYGKIKDISRPDWIMRYPGMICLAANQVWWTSEVEEVFQKIKLGNKRAMKEYLEKQNKQIDDLVKKVREDLTSNDRKKFKTIATIDVHARDIIEAFVRDSVLDAQEFGWESQLRFYWMKDVDNLYVVQCTGQFEYGYEYMGLNGRLVITPLTDRIYLTITQALTMRLGAAPSGPAGTGKTETTKDLAKAIALLCIVTNCGEGMDYRAVGTILSGLVQCGAWGCFDEFNRIDVSVLSVISTQLQTIRNGLLTNSIRFTFDGREINLNKNVGIFITMNPGYAGRVELPESIKAIFRPVTCIMPDLELICLISLFSDGFLTAKVLAKKMTVLYKLAREQLSKQYHYDWGLRSMNAVLRMAGVVKRSMPDTAENVVLMKVLRDSNIPKFVFDDVPLFLGLLKDLFPGVECPRIGYPDLNQAITLILESNNFILLPDQIDKVVQLYETMLTRHCAMLVGPTGGGKSVVINTLVKAQTSMGFPTKLTVLNPKACSVIELYGHLDIETRDWVDGLFSNIFREMNKPADENVKRYICFDGDVDALWIENMNSVMDDNKLLTLSNGERIFLQSHCSLLFEVGNLAYASPATVSRAGMVFVDPKNLGYYPYWQRWLKTRPKTEQQKLEEIYQAIVPECIGYILEGVDGSTQVEPLKMIVPQTDLNMTVQLCYMLDALCPHNENVKTVYDDEALECIFLECVYYSLGAALVEESRKRFDAFIKKISPRMAVDDSEDSPANNTQFPTSHPTLFDYFFDNEKKQWIAWEWIVPMYTHNPLIKFNDILVPTVDTLRTEKILSLMNDIKRPIVLVGESGTAKTAIISSCLRNLNMDTYILLNINFSSRTTSMDVQKTIEAAVEKRTKNIYGPPVGRKLVAFIDDMNMPKVDEYGTQQPIALLKLLLEHGGMYDRGKDLNWKIYKDISFMAAMGKAGGGRNEVDPRFLSMFTVVNLLFPVDATLKHIYGNILKGHLENFPESLISVADIIIQITLNLFKIISTELPPTPSKFHYIFNLKDLSRTFAGMTLISPKIFQDPKQLLRVWRNEFMRVFCDRLNTYEDVELMKKHLASGINKHFQQPDRRTRLTKKSVETIGVKESLSEMRINDYVLRDPILFGDYRHGIVDEEERLYEDLLDYGAVMHLFKEIIDEYNDRTGFLDLVFFDDCLDHLTRVHRVLRMYKGHLLLIGVGGCGKHSIVKLASFAAGCDIFEITLNRNYNENSFKEDLKTLFYKLIEEPTVFLFSSAQIAEEGFLEFINNILTTGIVPALFTDEERDMIIVNCRDAAKKAGYSVSKDGVWKYFHDKCAENLHVVLSMSPSGDMLRNRCRNFPGLIGNTTIDWVFPWPDQALHSVARGFLMENKKIPDFLKESISDHVVHVHNSLNYYTQEYLATLKRRNFITPKHYLDYLNTYVKLLEEKDQFTSKQINRLTDGTQKISFASTQIGELRKEVEETQLKVVESAEICEEFLKNIDESSQKTIRKKKELSERAQELDQSRKKIHIESAEAEEALEKALPALEQARLALDQLNKNDITEIRSFATPPESVQIVCECVAIIKGYREISWKTAKGMMAEGNFLKSLQELNVDNITPKQVANVRSHMKKSTKLDEMKAVSKAGFGLLKYVRAVLGYCDVFREVKPKRDRVTNLQKELQEKLEVLKAWEEQIQVMEEDLVKMNRDYEESIRKKEELKDLLEMSERRLSAADRLIAGLISEQSRWTDDLERFKREKINIVGSCLLSSAFMAYLAAFSSEFRKSIIYEDWLVNMQENDIPINIPFRLEGNLSNDVEISTWNSQGLPPDEFSIQNGILTLKGSRFPLCIDPQQQALSWIKKMELNNLKILSFTDPDYLKHLEMAIKYGNPVLFQDIDDFIDPVIENVLEKNFRYRTGQVFVTLGDKEVDVDSNFRLYMTTKISNPILEPSIYAKALVINYAVTFDGLEDQLLGVVVRSERLDLEEQREMLVEETFINKNLLATLEDSLLRELTSSTGNMLDNVELIETLENTKLKSTEVSAKLEEAAITAHDIEIVRNGYRPAAQRGALLFFVLSELSLVNPMYQYSLTSYLDLFSHSLKKAETSYDLDKRLDNILKTLTKNVYEFGCIGIFEKHKLMFSFQMTAKLQKHISQLSQKEFEFFIKGSVSLEKSEKVCPAPWLSESGWQNFLKLAADFQEPFSDILEHFENHTMEWKDWYDLEMPESVDYPGGFCDQMTEFQKMMVLRCFRVDRVYRAMSNYIADIMGEEYITPPVVNLDSIFQQTTTTMPVMFMLSPGSDPSEELRKLAERHGMGGEKLKYLSLGQGQEGAALKLLELSAMEGYWLVLQNGHLLLSFIKFLEKYLEKSENLHSEFRLWITTEPISTFPIGILQRSLKVVTEPPNGLKLNLRATFIKLQPDTLEMCAHEAFKPLVYVVAFFNAVVQERRKYGKMGWNISYDFNESDLNVSLQILNTYLSKVIKDERIPWSSLKYLIGEVMYGGRVIDDFDRRIVRVYMEEYMGDFLFDTFQPFHFYRDDSVDYKIPFISTRDHLIETTDSLPLSNTPEVFGLHPNAEIGYYTQTTREIWNHLIELQPQTGSAGDGISRDEFIDNVAKDILRHLPPPFIIWKIKKSFAMNITPTLVVLLQELERFNTLVERMSSTLNMLRKALAGEIGMDALLEQIATSLYNGQIPDNWRRWAPDTCKQLASWMDHLNHRNVQYKYWSSSGEPLVMWLSGLHIPESFLTALVQIACRKNNWPLDRSTLFTTVTDYSDPDDVEDRPLSGCYVHGLFLEGARWSLRNKCLEKSLPKVLVEPLPILSIQPIEAHRLKLQNTFRTPVYTTSKRRNAMGVGLVFEADLGTTVHVNRWVLQSVCLTLNDD